MIEYDKNGFIKTIPLYKKRRDGKMCFVVVCKENRDDIYAETTTMFTLDELKTTIKEHI